VEEGFCDRMTADWDKALRWIHEALKSGTALSIGLAGNAG